MNKRHIWLLLILIFLIIFCPLLSARTGGAGGGSRSSSRSSSGSGGDGLGLLIYWIIVSIPFPYNMIVLAIIFFAFILFGKNKRQSSVYNSMSSGERPPSNRSSKTGLDNFKTKNPQFNEQDFLQKVRTAYKQINDGWQKKDMSQTRRYISDGVYQRFHAQFEMMNKLKQTNRMDNISIHYMGIDQVETDGYFDAITVRISASLTDHFESSMYPQLNSGGYEEFTEYWTFLKKQGGENKDIYRSNACPSCGGELPSDMGEVSRCPYCKRLSNTGEFDWILSEITQADDYLATGRIRYNSKLKKEIARLSAENEDFSVQLLEDKVSNGYLRILLAQIEGKPETVRRFVSDELYETIKAETFEKNTVFNRLYLNYVSLIASGSTDSDNVLVFSVKETSQRIIIGEKRPKMIDPQPVSKNRVIVLRRDRTKSVSAGSVFSYSCPSCGGEIQDSLQIECSYCGNAFNSVSFDWVITNVMKPEEYNLYMKENAIAFEAKSDVDLTVALYKVRDYAINNVMITLGADGVFQEKEITFAQAIAKKWGYNLAKIQALFQMAQAGRLVIRMPDSPKDRLRIYKLMQKAAGADENIAPEEQQILDYVYNTFNIADVS